MNGKRYFFATIALFIYTILYEWITHDVILINLYQETIHVWRDFSEIETLMPWILIYQLAMSACVALFFALVFKEGGVLNGLLFGLCLGVFGGILTASWYLWLPVPAKLGWTWLINSIIQGIGGGLVLGAIYKK